MLAVALLLAFVGELYFNAMDYLTYSWTPERLYDPGEGRILLDGYDLREYSLGDLRDTIGVIFQDFVRYHLTAGENIAVGPIDLRHDRARIEAAAASGQADQVIAKLAQG